jgi:hypothetical protein
VRGAASDSHRGLNSRHHLYGSADMPDEQARRPPEPHEAQG